MILDQKDLIISNYVKSERDCELLIWRQFYKKRRAQVFEVVLSTNLLGTELK